jgi:hypothetical protein
MAFQNFYSLKNVSTALCRFYVQADPVRHERVMRKRCVTAVDVDILHERQPQQLNYHRLKLVLVPCGTSHKATQPPR